MICKFIFRIIIVCTLLISIITAQETRPKIGIVLSGGGARGLAHIGIIKLIDSLQIPIDYIAGTSMGGIVGGLYAAGYKGTEIEKYITETDWDALFLDKPPRSDIPYLEKKDDGKFQVELGLEGFTPVIPSALIQGQNVSLRFSYLTSSVESIQDFDKLPIPFRCVAIDLVSGKEVVLHSGSLAKAMRATMAIPTVFSPVDWGDSLLVDGGLLNNFPADILKEMGAEVIIGVNVGTPLKSKGELKSLLEVLEQTMALTDIKKQKDNSKFCELIINPDLENFKVADFEPESIKEIIHRGNIAAAQNKYKLIEIKEKYVIPYSSTETQSAKSPLIASIFITGNSLYTLEYLYKMIGHKPNDKLDIEKLNNKISQLRTSGLFKNINVETIPHEQDQVILKVSLITEEKPIIHGVSVIGNKALGFDFINDLFGFKPGDTFDKEKINKKIKYIYGLGYFDGLTYTTTPVKENYIHLNLYVEEKPSRKLRLGFRYDDAYKLVGIIGLQGTNVPFAGMRSEAFLQFAGLVKFDYNLSYPSRTLNLPIFPYINVCYKNIPIDLYHYKSGDKISEYNDKSWSFAAGIGFNLFESSILKVEYIDEFIDVNPSILSTDEDFPSWNTELNMLRSEFIMDLLDDPILPTHGFKIKAEYTRSLKSLNSDLYFWHYQMHFKYYIPAAKHQNFGLMGYYTNSSDDFPAYKWPVKGGASSFIGMKINQIEGYHYSYLRLDYRYRHKKDIFLKLIANAGYYNFTHPAIFEKFENPLYGFGIAVKFLSIIGPFEIIFAKGSRSVAHWDEFVPHVYFTAGFQFK